MKNVNNGDVDEDDVDDVVDVHVRDIIGNVFHHNSSISFQGS